MVKRIKASEILSALRRLWHRWCGLNLGTKLFYGALVLFVLQASILAAITKFGIPPDETNHITFIDYYTDHSLSPFLSDQQPTLNLGDKTREVDYIYHYAMSLVRRVLPFSTTAEHYIIRYISVAFAVLTFLVLRRVFLRLGFSDAISALTVLLASLFPMVLMMSSSVNNDVLVWLMFAVGLLLLLRLAERPRALDMIWLASLVTYGGLVKRTLLPIGLVFAVAGIVFVSKRWKPIAIELRRPKWSIVIALTILILGFGLVTERIGGNLLRYGRVDPTCSEIKGEDACEVFWWNIREKNLATLPPEPTISPLIFAVKWAHESAFNIIDIQTQGWRHETKPPFWLEPLVFVPFVIAIIYGTGYEIKRLHQYRQAMQRLVVLGLSLMYIFVYLLVNYSEYTHSHVFGLALNGRYILAGFLPLIGMAVWYWFIMLRRWTGLRYVLLGVIILAMAVTSGLSLLLQNPQLVTY